ncbi:hypothetical protein PTKIN_Ptkin17bG0004300 [Pterospermum kingtungense]
MILWAIWRNRNDKLWRNDLQPARVAVFRALDFLYSWLSARKLSSVSSTGSVGGVLFCSSWVHAGILPSKEAEALCLLDAFGWVHSLAKAASSHASPFEWGTTPSFIRELVVADCTASPAIMI